jgi:hypothetical protein
MNYEVVVFGQVAVIVVFLVGSLSAIGVLTTRAIQRTVRREPKGSASDDRLEQLQQSVDAIAIEVERIAEAQRFTAKLLAERSETVSPGSR